MNDKPAKPNIVATPTPISSASLPVASRSIHVVTMSKGGVGKTVCASALAQWLMDKERSVSVIDLDPMSHSLAELRGLNARPVDLLTGRDMEFNGQAMDRLAEDMLESSDDFVLDNGAAGFVALTRYLCDNGFSDMLRSREGALVVHAVLGGGSMAAQCLIGLHTLLESFERDVRFVLWVNEHSGPFMVDGVPLTDMAVFKNNRERVAGVVTLSRLPRYHLDDFARMQADGLTYREAMESPKFLLMNKQRLTMIRRGIWSQLDGLKLI